MLKFQINLQQSLKKYLNELLDLLFYDHIYYSKFFYLGYVSQPAFTSSKLTKETLEQGVRYVQF